MQYREILGGIAMHEVGQILTLRKKHPCGGQTWEVIKPGVDTRLKCTTCGRVILIPRDKLVRQIKGQSTPPR
ncbi:MAG: DUF951 domain-containing protein [Limnochordia bacterium]|nr:DUF951 domain-containing protein [Limnochordia bacterium]